MPDPNNPNPAGNPPDYSGRPGVTTQVPGGPPPVAPPEPPDPSEHPPPAPSTPAPGQGGTSGQPAAGPNDPNLGGLAPPGSANAPDALSDQAVLNWHSGYRRVKDEVDGDILTRRFYTIDYKPGAEWLAANPGANPANPLADAPDTLVATARFRRQPDGTWRQISGTNLPDQQIDSSERGGFRAPIIHVSGEHTFIADARDPGAFTLLKTSEAGKHTVLVVRDKEGTETSYQDTDNDKRPDTIVVSNPDGTRKQVSALNPDGTTTPELGTFDLANGGKVTITENSNGAKQQTTYDANGVPQQTIVYDVNGKPISIGYYGENGQIERVGTIEQNAAGESVVAPLSGTWPGYGAREYEYGHDANGNLTRTMRAASGEVTVEVRLPSGDWYLVSRSDGQTNTEFIDTDGDGSADQIRITDPNGTVRTGNLIPDPQKPGSFIIQPLTGEWNLTGNSAGQTITYETGANGRPVRHIRNAAGEITRVEVQGEDGQWQMIFARTEDGGTVNVVTAADGSTNTVYRNAAGDIVQETAVSAAGDTVIYLPDGTTIFPDRQNPHKRLVVLKDGTRLQQEKGTDAAGKPIWHTVSATDPSGKPYLQLPEGLTPPTYDVKTEEGENVTVTHIDANNRVLTFADGSTQTQTRGADGKWKLTAATTPDGQPYIQLPDGSFVPPSYRTQTEDGQNIHVVHLPGGTRRTLTLDDGTVIEQTLGQDGKWLNSKTQNADGSVTEYADTDGDGDTDTATTTTPDGTTTVHADTDGDGDTDTATTTTPDGTTTVQKAIAPADTGHKRFEITTTKPGETPVTEIHTILGPNQTRIEMQDGTIIVRTVNADGTISIRDEKTGITTIYGKDGRAITTTQGRGSKVYYHNQRRYEGIWPEQETRYEYDDDGNVVRMIITIPGIKEWISTLTPEQAAAWGEPERLVRENRWTRDAIDHIIIYIPDPANPGEWIVDDDATRNAQIAQYRKHLSAWGKFSGDVARDYRDLVSIDAVADHDLKLYGTLDPYYGGHTLRRWGKEALVDAINAAWRRGEARPDAAALQEAINAGIMAAWREKAESSDEDRRDEEANRRGSGYFTVNEDGSITTGITPGATVIGPNGEILQQGTTDAIAGVIGGAFWHQMQEGTAGGPDVPGSAEWHRLQAIKDLERSVIETADPNDPNFLNWVLNTPAAAGIKITLPTENTPTTGELNNTTLGAWAQTRLDQLKAEQKAKDEYEAAMNAWRKEAQNYLINAGIDPNWVRGLTDGALGGAVDALSAEAGHGPAGSDLAGSTPPPISGVDALTTQGDADDLTTTDAISPAATNQRAQDAAAITAWRKQALQYLIDSGVDPGWVNTLSNQELNGAVQALAAEAGHSGAAGSDLAGPQIITPPSTTYGYTGDLAGAGHTVNWRPSTTYGYTGDLAGAGHTVNWRPSTTYGYTGDLEGHVENLSLGDWRPGDFLFGGEYTGYGGDLEGHAFAQRSLPPYPTDLRFAGHRGRTDLARRQKEWQELARATNPAALEQLSGSQNYPGYAGDLEGHAFAQQSLPPYPTDVRFPGHRGRTDLLRRQKEWREMARANNPARLAENQRFEEGVALAANILGQHQSKPVDSRFPSLASAAGQAHSRNLQFQKNAIDRLLSAGFTPDEAKIIVREAMARDSAAAARRIESKLTLDVPYVPSWADPGIGYVPVAGTVLAGAQMAPGGFTPGEIALLGGSAAVDFAPIPIPGAIARAPGRALGRVGRGIGATGAYIGANWPRVQVVPVGGQMYGGIGLPDLSNLPLKFTRRGPKTPETQPPKPPTPPEGIGMPFLRGIDDAAAAAGDTAGGLTPPTKVWVPQHIRRAWTRGPIPDRPVLPEIGSAARPAWRQGPTPSHPNVPNIGSAARPGWRQGAIPDRPVLPEIGSAARPAWRQGPNPRTTTTGDIVLPQRPDGTLLTAPDIPAGFAQANPLAGLDLPSIRAAQARINAANAAAARAAPAPGAWRGAATAPGWTLPLPDTLPETAPATAPETEPAPAPAPLIVPPPETETVPGPELQPQRQEEPRRGTKPGTTTAPRPDAAPGTSPGTQPGPSEQPGPAEQPAPSEQPAPGEQPAPAEQPAPQEQPQPQPQPQEQPQPQPAPQEQPGPQEQPAPAPAPELTYLQGPEPLEQPSTAPQQQEQPQPDPFAQPDPFRMPFDTPARLRLRLPGEAPLRLRQPTGTAPRLLGPLVPTGPEPQTPGDGFGPGPTPPDWTPTDPDHPRHRKPGEEPEPRPKRLRLRRPRKDDEKTVSQDLEGNYPHLVKKIQTIETITNLLTGEAVVSPITPPEDITVIARSRQKPPAGERWTGGTKITVGPRGNAGLKAAKPRRRTIAKKQRHPYDEFRSQGRRR